MTTFKVQTSSSTVNWTGKKVLGLHTGNINIARGSIDIEDSLIKGGEIEIDMTSITITDIDDPKTHNDFLAHLQHEDFFAVDKFRSASLTITGSEKSESNRLKITGNLTIKDISQPVSFTASVEVFTDYLHSLGEMVIDRTAYNIRYGSGKFLQNLGDKLIYDDFILQFKLIGQA